MAYRVGVTPRAKKSPTQEQRVLDSTSRDPEPPPTCVPTPCHRTARAGNPSPLKRIPVAHRARRVPTHGSDCLGYKQGHITFPRQDHLQQTQGNPYTTYIYIYIYVSLIYISFICVYIDINMHTPIHTNTPRNTKHRTHTHIRKYFK